MKRLLPRLLLATAILASLGLTACNDDAVKTEQLDRVVWSDDNTEEALIVLKFEEKHSMNPLDGTTLKSNFSHQVYVQNRDGSNRHPIGNEFLGQNGFDFYYMKSAGYLIASYIATGSDDNPVTRYYQLKLDGSVNQLTSKPDMRVIPSPNGAYLALITFYPAACGNPAGNCPMDVEFLDANSLASVGKKQQLSFEHGKTPELTWNLGGQFLLTTDEQTFAVRPDAEEPSPANTPACTYPPTSSSSIATSGDFVYPAQNQVQTRPTTQSEQPFGCQDIAS